MDNFFDTTISMDLKQLIIGRPLGKGSFREVYIYNPDPTCVIKFEKESKRFSNVIEYETWRAVEDTKYAKWFAPVIDISPCGTFLIQKRTEPLLDKKLPKKIPPIFTDLKLENVGVYEDHVCFHDYGLNRMIFQKVNDKMVEADWWSINQVGES